MELKRYVLLKTKSIVDTQNDTNFIYELKLISVAYLKKVSEVIDDLVEKSSDNILDLVEVGDLVATERDVQRIENLDFETQFILHHNRNYNIVMNKENVIEIYKKQPNGDYKRYEVKA